VRLAKLTQRVLKELVAYDPSTGDFVWKIRADEHFKTYASKNKWNATYPGAVAGTSVITIDGKWYRNIQVQGEKCRAHRLAWFYVHGYWPNVIDHVNGTGLDNRLCNLRDVSPSENMRNMRRTKANRSGTTGVCGDTTRKKWMATITAGGKNMYLGRYDHISEAENARKKAEIAYGYRLKHGESRPL
jgi:hypothetical protein